MKHNTKQALLALVITLFASLVYLGFYQPVGAEPAPVNSSSVTCPDGSVVADNNTACPIALNCKEEGGKQVCTAAKTNDTCGNVKTSIDFGCKGTGNPVIDFLLAILRFMTVGVGLVLILMTVISGIQYTVSQGDPAATKAVKLRLLGIGIALVVYLLGMALLNYLVPGGILG